jgi:hypothetical protein
VACPPLQAPEAEVTDEQTENERASTEAFVQDAIIQVRPTFTNAAVGYVLISAAYAAAHIAPRKANGEIDREQAEAILHEAASMLKAYKRKNAQR